MGDSTITTIQQTTTALAESRLHAEDGLMNEDGPSSSSSTQMVTTTGTGSDIVVNINRKRDDYLSWPDYFMAVASLSAMRSKDPCSQVTELVHDDEMN
jgi:deoxycytidylate deaminase